MAIKNYMGEEFESVSKAVLAHLEGSSYSNSGQLELLEEQDANTMLAFANLIQLLVAKGVLTEGEVQHTILDGLYA